jgi:hypothetical protein
MKIKTHPESHVVVLEDGSSWQIFPGDVDVTLGWKPETDLTLLRADDRLCSHLLSSDCGVVRVIPSDEAWRESQVKADLKEG